MLMATLQAFHEHIGSRNHSENCPVTEEWFIKTLKVCVCVASSLSIIGALLIIGALYCVRRQNKAKKQLQENTNMPDHEPLLSSIDDTLSVTSRKSARDMDNDNNQVINHPAWLILTFISIADVVVAASHTWGIVSNYENLHHVHVSSLNQYRSNISHMDEGAECGAQAVLAIFGVLSSFLWSDLLAFIAVVLRVVSKEYNHHFVSVRAFIVYNVICWGVPFLLVCILGGINALGFAEGVDVGESVDACTVKKEGVCRDV